MPPAEPLRLYCQKAQLVKTPVALGNPLVGGLVNVGSPPPVASSHSELPATRLSKLLIA